jgi:hypothetical protein
MIGNPQRGSGARAVEMTPAAGPSSLSDLALNSDHRERAIEMTLAAGPSARSTTVWRAGTREKLHPHRWHSRR